MTTVYIKTGTTSWTVPSGVSSINIQIIGAGAQGYGGTGNVNNGGGGGVAATVLNVNNISVTPGQVIPCSVGARGSKSADHTSNNTAPWHNSGSSGGTTTFGDAGSVGPYTSNGAQDLSSGWANSSAPGANGASTGLTGDGSSNAAQGDGNAGGQGVGGSGYGSGGGGGHSGTNDGGQASDGIIIITYTAAVTPVASFTYAPSSGNAPLTVNFTDTSSNTPTSWDWDFGDGSAHSSSQNPSHTYTAAGTFTVTLKATNAAGTSSPVTHTVSVTSSPVAAFVLNPGNIGPVQQATNAAIYTQQIKCFDQSYVAGSIINQWSWTCSATGATFSSATAQNPVLTVPAIGANATFTVSLTVTTSAGVPSSTTTKTVFQQAALVTKPLASDYYKNISIFLYSPPVPASVPSGVTIPCATVLNRVRSPGNNLFFTDFQCTGSIDKAGTLNFTAVDLGFSTAAERYLLTTAGIYVVVVVGYAVVWSGQILRAINNVTQIYSGTTGYAQYAVECESDIGKMKNQYVATSSQGTVTGTTGAIVSQLIQPNLSTDPNWNGAVDPSIISREGNNIAYTITSADVYDQFITLANSSGFDWRTRMQVYKAAASAIAPGWSSASTYTFGNTVTPYTTNSFTGKWVLFASPSYNVITFAYNTGGGNNGGVQLYAGDQVRETGGTVFGTVVSVTTTSGSWAAGTAVGTIVIYSGQTWTGSQYFDGLTAGANCAYITSITSTVLTANQNGIMSWGYCTSNTTTVLTCSPVQNQGMMMSAGTAFAIVLEGPVLDYAWSLEPPMPSQTMLANAASDPTTFQGLGFSDNSDYKSLATVVTVKGKTVVPTQGTGIGSTINSTLYAKDQWDGTYNFFKNCTYVTQRMDGYVYSYATSATTIVLIGQGYALANGDTFYVYATGSTNGVTSVYGPRTISGTPTIETQADGTLTTTVTFSGAYLDTQPLNKYGAFISVKTYVADPVWMWGTGSYPITAYIGGLLLNQRTYSAGYTGVSASATYGNYITLAGTGAGAFPTGAIPIPALPGTLLSWTSPTGTPNTQSPLAYYGPILYTQTVDQNITQSDLDVYASQALVNKSFYLRKASITAKLITDYCAPEWRSQYETSNPHMVREGNVITVLTSLSVSPGNDPSIQWPDGQYMNRWQIMSWMLDGSTMQVVCELGDYEKNTYTMMQQLTSSSNQTLT